MKLLRRLLHGVDRCGQVLLAYGFRWTGLKLFIFAFRWRRDILLSPEEMLAFAQALRNRPGSLLVFGAGHDSILWSIINRAGPSVFLESERYWIKRIGAQWKGLHIHEIHYASKHENLGLMAAGEKPPPLDLPDLVRDRKWDFILVDAPQGWGDGPGRSQSIHEASRLVADNGLIFVHDCDREDERELTIRHLGDFHRRPLNHRFWSFQKCSPARD